MEERQVLSIGEASETVSAGGRWDFSHSLELAFRKQLGTKRSPSHSNPHILYRTTNHRSHSAPPAQLPAPATAPSGRFPVQVRPAGNWKRSSSGRWCRGKCLAIRIAAFPFPFSLSAHSPPPPNPGGSGPRGEVSIHKAGHTCTPNTGSACPRSEEEGGVELEFETEVAKWSGLNDGPRFTELWHSLKRSLRN